MKAIIANAYKIFRYERPTNITNVCIECCMSIEDARLLLTNNLNEIPLELVHEYNDGAQALNLNINEFKYFLPRYLELISEFQFTSAVDICLSLKNLKFDDANIWTSSDEVNCINDFAKTFFQECLKTDAYCKEAQLIDIINMFYISGVDVIPFFQIWLEDLSNFSIIHLDHLIADNFNYREKFKSSAFIDSDLKSIIENWIKNNKLIIIYVIENHIKHNFLKEEQLQKLGYLHDTMNYL